MLKAATNKRSTMNKVKTPKVQRAKTMKTARKPLRKVTKRTLSTTAAAAETDEQDLLADAPYPLAPYSSSEQIRNALAKYKDASAMTDAESPFQGLGQIIKSHGKLPFAFFALAALASKEIYLVDPGLLITFNTSTVIFSYYALGYEGAKNAYNEFVDNINSKYQEGLKTSSAILEAGIKHCQSALDKPGIITDANKAFQEAHDALTEARVRVQQQAHKDAILGKLNVIVASEAAEAKAQADAIRAEAMTFLKKEAFADKIKEDVMNEALSMVGKKSASDTVEFKALQNVLKASLDHAQKVKK